MASARRFTATISQRPSEAIVQARAGLTPDAADDSADAKKSPAAEATKASLGITLQPLTAQLRQQLKIADTVKGVVIAGITPVERCRHQRPAARRHHPADQPEADDDAGRSRCGCRCGAQGAVATRC